METKESNAASTQEVAFEIQEKEERVLNQKALEPVTTSKGGPVDMELVGKRLAESQNETSSSGNNGDDGSQSAAGRGEDSSDENGDTNQDFSAMKQQMLTQMHQTGAVQNNARVQYSGTNTNLNLLSFGANIPETHLNFEMDLNVSSGHAICTKEDHEQRRREKRKESNRESARRSRFRRQQEREKLREIAEMLKSEISELPNELRRLSEECGKLDEENSSLIDAMEEMYGPDAVSDLRAVKVNPSDGGSNSIELKTPSRDDSTSTTPPEPRLFGISLRANFADCLRS